MLSYIGYAGSLGYKWVYNPNYDDGITNVLPQNLKIFRYDYNITGTSKWQMILSETDGVIRGKEWNGTYWINNNTIINGLGDWSNRNAKGDLVYNFYGNNKWTIIGYQSDGLSSTLKGFEYNGSYWNTNSTLYNGLPNSIGGMAVFCFDYIPNEDKWVGIVEQYATPNNDISAYEYNGTHWISNSTFKNGIPSVQYSSYHYCDLEYNLFNESQMILMDSEAVNRGNISAYYWNGTYWIAKENPYDLDDYDSKMGWFDVNYGYGLGNWSLFEGLGGSGSWHKGFDWREVFAPDYSNLITYPTSPTTYSPNKNYQFNSTWVDEDTVILQFNNVNYTVSEIDGQYTKTFTDLSAGTYQYRWFANSSDGYWNSTSLTDYTINKANPDLHLAINGQEQDFSRQYAGQTEINATAWAITDLTLLLDGIEIDNPYVSFFDVGTYNFTAIAGNENYTTSSITRMVYLTTSSTGITRAILLIVPLVIIIGILLIIIRDFKTISVEELFYQFVKWFIIGVVGIAFIVVLLSLI